MCDDFLVAKNTANLSIRRFIKAQRVQLPATAAIGRIIRIPDRTAGHNMRQKPPFPTLSPVTDEL